MIRRRHVRSESTVRHIRSCDVDALGAGPWPEPGAPRAVPLPAGADFVVVGGGLTGWSAGARLAASGTDVVVLDRGFGGRARRAGPEESSLADTLVGPSEGFADCGERLQTWMAAHGTGVPSEWNGVLELIRDVAPPIGDAGLWDQGTLRVAATVAGGAVDLAALLKCLADQRSTAVLGSSIAST